MLIVTVALDGKLLSLSARRAWIEMWWGVRKAVGSLVALRKESVDRNGLFAGLIFFFCGRSPQGERG